MEKEKEPDIKNNVFVDIFLGEDRWRFFDQKTRRALCLTCRNGARLMRQVKETPAPFPQMFFGGPKVLYQLYKRAEKLSVGFTVDNAEARMLLRWVFKEGAPITNTANSFIRMSECEAPIPLLK